MTSCRPQRHRRSSTSRRSPSVAARPLAGRRDRRREGDPAAPGRMPSSCSRRAFECVVDLGPEPEGRAHVAVRGGRQRGDRRGRPRRGDVQGRDARASSVAAARPRAARARGAPRSRRGALPRAQAGAGLGDPRPRSSYTLHGSAICTDAGTRRMIGVTAQGMTACPCAQELVAAAARERACRSRVRRREIDRILEAVPVATHNQRGLGTLHIGCPRDRAGHRDRRRDAAARSSSSRCRRRSTS